MCASNEESLCPQSCKTHTQKARPRERSGDGLPRRQCWPRDHISDDKGTGQAQGTSLPAGGAAEVGSWEGAGRLLSAQEAPARSPAGLCVWPSRLSGPQGHCCKGTCGGRRGLRGQPARLPELQLRFCWDPWKRGLLHKRNSEHLPDRAAARPAHRTHPSSSFPAPPPRRERSDFSMISAH